MWHGRWRPLPVLLLWLLCSSLSAGAEPVTTEELVTELLAISALLETARIEYQTVSTELQRLQAELARLQIVDLPLWRMRLDALRTSYDDYRRTVSREINRLRAGMYGAIGLAIVAGVLAVGAMFR